MRAELFLLGFLFACGARTELKVDDVAPSGGGAAGAGGEAGPGGGGAGLGGGGSGLGGGGFGAGGEGGQGGEGGALPECSPGAELVYLVTDAYDLYSYDPASGDVDLRGTLACDSDATPFSMSVDRTGIAYVLYNDGNLFRVSTKTGNCSPTDFVPNQLGFDLFGMGFARDIATETDELFVSHILFSEPNLISNGLAKIDLDTYSLGLVGPYFSPLTNTMEMTSASDGNLYGFALQNELGGGTIVELDKDTAEIVSEVFVPVASGTTALAFAYWGGDFYIFTSDGGGSIATRYRPSDGDVTVVRDFTETVVGAGVSTCDPAK